jgi:DNA polymerase-3 subunit gamma/tau
MPVLSAHCQAIMESRHMDVLEMDAASIPASMTSARS